HKTELAVGRRAGGRDRAGDAVHAIPGLFCDSGDGAVRARDALCAHDIRRHARADRAANRARLRSPVVSLAAFCRDSYSDHMNRWKPAFVASVVAVVLLSIALATALAKQGVVTTKSGQTYEGDVIERPDGVIIIAKGIQTRVAKDDVATVTYG